MPASSLSPLVRLLVCVSLPLAACESTDEAVRTEVVPLAEGDYFGARWGGAQVERFYTVAWRGTPKEPDGHAVIVSPDHEEPCDLGTSVQRYTSLRPQSASKYVIGSPSPARITLLEDVDDEGFGTLTFADINCKRIDLRVPDVNSKRGLAHVYDPDQTHLRFGVFNRAGSLIFVDPWAQEQREVAQNVTSQIVQFETGAWLLEGDELVKRDLDGNELARRGSGVSSFLLLGSKGDIVYHEERGVYTIRSGKATRIAKTNCAYLNNLDAFIPGAIGYFEEPCEENKLRVTVGEDKTYEYGAGITAVATSASMMVYTTLDGDKTKLWLVDGADPMKPKLVTEMDQFALRAIIMLPGGITALLANEPAQGEMTQGTLSVWELKRTSDRISVEKLTSGIVGYARSENAIAVQYDTGELILANGALDRVILRVDVPAQARYQFIMGGKALGLVYLGDIDPETNLGSLELQLLTGQHYTLAHDVREFEYVWWPERGLVHVTGGKDPGVHFVRIDIPCEASSDAPWACGL